MFISKTGQIHVYFQNEINPQNLKFQINISEKVGSLDFSKGGFMFLWCRCILCCNIFAVEKLQILEEKELRFLPFD